MKDVSSFGMQLVALSLPDVIRSDWGNNSHDCFWGAVTHDYACAIAKLPIAVFPSLSFLFLWLPASRKICKYNKNSSSAPNLLKIIYIVMYCEYPNCVSHEQDI